jgi:hypothetical protein
VLEIIPAPLRYHLGLTPAAGTGLSRAGTAGPPGWRWPLLTSRGIVGIPLRCGQL